MEATMKDVDLQKEIAPKAFDKKNLFASKYTRLVGIVSVIILALFIIIFLLILFNNRNQNSTPNNSNNNQNNNGDSTVEPTTTVVPTITPTTSPTAKVDKDRILYSDFNGLYVIDIDGKNKKSIIEIDDPSKTRITAFDWKSAGIVSYAICSGDCRIYERDLDTDKEEIAWNGRPFVQSIDSIDWGDNGSILAMIFTNSDYSSTAAIYKNGNLQELKAYSIVPGRGLGYNDGRSVQFSQDSKYISVFNTLYGDGGEKSLYVYTQSGSLIYEIQGVHPTFGAKDTLYFKQGNIVKKKTLPAGNVEDFFNVGGESGYNLNASPAGDLILYWRFEPKLESFTHDGKSSKQLAAEVVNGSWVNNDKIVGFKTKTEKIIELGYDVDSLVLIDKNTKTVSPIVSGAIIDFRIE